MSLPRYPRYQDSGVSWIGQVPAHWRVDRFKASVADARNGIWGDEPAGDETDIACVRVADFDRARLKVKPVIPTIRSVSEKERKGRVLKAGDLLLEKSGGGESQPVGQVVLFLGDEPAVCSNFVARVELKAGMVPRYWNYAHSAAYAVGVNVGAINQTSGIQNLDQQRYFNERAPFPPEDEQTAIATFLDHETAKIDGLIAEQEKLIALLAEKRQATISHAVTRGLNPQAPMRDSGVPWLGEVPAHWQVVRLGALFRQVNMPGDASLPVLSVSIHDGVSDKELDESEMDRKVSRSEDRSKYKAVLPGDLTYNMMRAWQGGFGSVTVEGMVSPAYVVARPTADFLTSHVEHILRTPNAVAEMKRHSRGITDFRLRLYWEEFKTIQIALPPMAEQNSIAHHIQGTTQRFDALASEAERGIDLLRERRSALIAAAVTGQIDVRGFTAA
jgi:type I restriction enzyme S subunit